MGLIQAIAATPGLRNIASMGGFGAQERAYMGEVDYGHYWWEEPADLEPEAEAPAIFLVCQQTDVLSDETPVFSQPFASDDDNLALSEDGYLINGESQFLFGIHVDEYGRVIADEPKIVHINTKNLRAAATNRLRYRVNLPTFPMTANADFDTPGAELLDKSLFARDPSTQGAGTVIGDDRMKFFNQSLAGGSVRVFARDGRSQQLVFRWAKMGSLRSAGRDIWNLFYRIRRDAQLQCITDAELFNEGGRPGECRADTAGQGDRTHHQSRLGIHTKDRRSTHANKVLQEDERGRQGQQDNQWPAA